ncbi:MAG TPA: hypothetical protein VGV15_22245 [Terriglobales bacterium]|nr:hypothetical protein [Terriglobales bacterium]
MPSVLVVPVYVEVPDGFERAVATLESHLRRAGYAFYTGEPLPVTLEETKRNMLARQTAAANSGWIGNS